MCVFAEYAVGYMFKMGNLSVTDQVCPDVEKIVKQRTINDGKGQKRFSV